MQSESLTVSTSQVMNIWLTKRYSCLFLSLFSLYSLSILSSLFSAKTTAFNLKRCISRTAVTLIAMFIGLTVPKFGKLLNLVGASAVTLQSFVLPCTFYYLLHRDSLGRTTKVLLITIIVVAIGVAISSSTSAVFDLFDPNAFTVPCFIKNCYNLDWTATTWTQDCKQDMYISSVDVTLSNSLRSVILYFTWVTFYRSDSVCSRVHRFSFCRSFLCSRSCLEVEISFSVRSTKKDWYSALLSYSFHLMLKKNFTAQFWHPSSWIFLYGSLGIEQRTYDSRQIFPFHWLTLITDRL